MVGTERSNLNMNVFLLGHAPKADWKRKGFHHHYPLINHHSCMYAYIGSLFLPFVSIYKFYKHKTLFRYVHIYMKPYLTSEIHYKLMGRDVELACFNIIRVEQRESSNMKISSTDTLLSTLSVEIDVELERCICFHVCTSKNVLHLTPGRLCGSSFICELLDFTRTPLYIKKKKTKKQKKRNVLHFFDE